MFNKRNSLILAVKYVWNLFKPTDMQYVISCLQIAGYVDV